MDNKIQECLFHSDKQYFYLTCKKIKSLKIMEKRFVDRYGMAVCTCQRKDKLKTKPVCENFNVIKHKVLDKITSLETEDNEKDIDFLINFIQHISVNGVYYKSACLFIAILFDAFLDNFTFLEMLCRKKEQKTRRADRFDDKNLVCLLNKKKNRAKFKNKLNIPLFGGNTKYLEMDKNIGRHFNVIGKQYNCVVEINGTETGHLMTLNKSTSVLDVWYNTIEDLKTVSHLLINIADQIQKSHMKKPARKYFRYLDWTSVHNIDKDRYSDIINPIDKKLKATESYDKKAFMKRKNGKPQKSQNRNLKESRCLHCLKSFDDVADPFSEYSCKYHPGYSVKETDTTKWICCNREVIDDKSSYKYNNDIMMFGSEGCTYGQHLWRNHKKPVKAKQKMSCNPLNDNLL